MNNVPHATAVYDSCFEQWNLSLGLLPHAAIALLRRDFPEVTEWLHWDMRRDTAQRALAAFVGEGILREGTIGRWRWQRVPCSYDGVYNWSGDLSRPHRGYGWLGALRLTHPDGASFLLFSCLGVDMETNANYFASTGDLKLLRRFAGDVQRALRPRRHRNLAHVNTIGQPDFTLKVNETEQVYLDDALLSDIYAQVDSFFANKKRYRAMNIPYKRGFLFTGHPGTGKTMLIRNLIRHCHRQHGAPAGYLAVHRRTDAEDLRLFFSAASDKRPVLLILEDIESLCQETALTRSEILAELDGLHPRSGMLLIATANDPGRIDPALVHRPSRFDRVWTFPLPDRALRARYLADQLAGIDPATLDTLADGTDGWTFAYIKELRNTAAILAIRDGGETLAPAHLHEALTLLRAQFKAGKTGHHQEASKADAPVGFGPAPTPRRPFREAARTDRDDLPF